MLRKWSGGCLLAMMLVVGTAHADGGWRGGDGGGWRGGEGEGGGAWGMGSALVGGLVGGMMAQQGPMYGAPPMVVAPPPVYVAPQPAYAYPAQGYAQPGYPAPMYAQPVYPAPYYGGGDDD